MQKYSKAEIEQIKYFLQRRDQLYEKNYTLSFERIVQQLKKELDIQISRTSLCSYSRKIGVGQCHVKKTDILEEKPEVQIGQKKPADELKQKESVVESYEGESDLIQLKQNRQKESDEPENKETISGSEESEPMQKLQKIPLNPENMLQIIPGQIQLQQAILNYHDAVKFAEENEQDDQKKVALRQKISLFIMKEKSADE
ncbi:Hypothetical_protein [Hexamita inflata]|uniref:Hypothetical_protein n=1 Tax=Hexamita inflata TaxID=28002 RepID=A0AA86NKC7_9EUKA|nr:Hypothetical protein HINF_LOCUS8228 [Hexamita inflata]